MRHRPTVGNALGEHVIVGQYCFEEETADVTVSAVSKRKELRTDIELQPDYG
jgi:hypothetical protein